MICLRCGHNWRENVKDPCQCPACKSYDWRTHRTMTEREVRATIAMCLRKLAPVISRTTKSVSIAWAKGLGGAYHKEVNAILLSTIRRFDYLTYQETQTCVIITTK